MCQRIKGWGFIQQLTKSDLDVKLLAEFRVGLREKKRIETQFEKGGIDVQVGNIDPTQIVNNVHQFSRIRSLRLVAGAGTTFELGCWHQVFASLQAEELAACLRTFRLRLSSEPLLATCAVFRSAAGRSRIVYVRMG